VASKIHYDSRRRHWWVKYWDGARWRKKVVGRPPKTWKGRGEPTPTPDALERAAELIEAERAARSRIETAAEQRLDDFLAAYRETYARTQAKGSADLLARCCASLLDFAAGRKITLVRELTPRACADYLEARAAAGIAHGTLSTQKGYLSAAWSAAVLVRRLESNPWRLLPIPARPEKKRRGSWTPEQFEALAREARPWLRELLTLGTQTGLRITALTSIGWTAIEWPAEGERGNGLLRLPAELDKVGRGYAVPLSRKAHELLARILAERGDDGGPILRGEKGGPTSGASTMTAIRRACKRAGLPDPDSPNHHMRRSFGRWAVFGQLTGRPVPLYVVSRWMGHSSVAMTQRYLQLDDDTSAEWMSEEG